MVVKEIRKGRKFISRIYHKGEIMFQRSPVVFQEVETFEEPNDTLIINGAYQINEYPNGLYLDCVPLPDTPDVPDTPEDPDTPTGDWAEPTLSGNVLYLSQVYKATLNGNVLEVE